MSNTLTIRFPDDLLEWLKTTSRQTGIPMGRLIREQMESARTADKNPLLQFAGVVKGGPRNLSSRKGFSRE